MCTISQDAWRLTCKASSNTESLSDKRSFDVCPIICGRSLIDSLGYNAAVKDQVFLAIIPDCEYGENPP